MKADLEKLDAVLLGGSADNEFCHLAWRESEPMLKEITHPLLFVSPTMADEWDVVHQSAGYLSRGTLIVDPDRVVRFCCSNDLDTGRNAGEVLRVLKALQTGELCQCSWQPGEKTLTQQGKG